MRATWSFTADMVQYGPFLARALENSTAPSRISCMSGPWYPAGTNKTKPLREVTRAQFMRDSTQSGGRWRNCCNAWGSRRWTTVSRTSFRLSRDGVQRNRCRPREPGHCLRNSSGIHPILAELAAAILAFIDPGCCVGRKMRRSPRTRTSLERRAALAPRHWGAQAACRKSSDAA